MSEVPMIGRDREMARLVEAFDTARRTRSAITVRIDGHPAVGTSRLVSEFRDVLSRRRLAHDWWFGACSRTAGIPFEPFATLLLGCPGGVGAWLEEASGLGEDPSGAAVLLGGLASRIRSSAQESAVVLAVDNVDAADVSTRRLLDAVGTAVGDAPALVLLAGRRPPADQPVMTTSATITLEPLTDDEIRRIIHAVGTPVNDVENVVVAAAGRPGVALALASSEAPASTLARMIAAIDPDAASAVVALGLADGALRASDVLSACRIDRDVLDLLAAHGVVRVGPAGTARVDEMWTEAARDVVSGGFAVLASGVAEALDRAGATSAAAHAWEAAGEVGRAAASWEEAARVAGRAGAVATAASWLRRSIELGDVERLVRVGRQAAAWSLAAGDWGEADRLADHLLARASRTDDDHRMGLLAIRYRARRELGSDDADGLLDAAVELADRSTTATPERADVLMLDALRRVLDDRTAAVRRSTQALTIAVEAGDETAIAAATASLAVAQALDGDVDGALQRFDEALERVERSGDLVTESRIASNKVYVLWRAGRPTDVVRAATEEIDRLDARNVGWLGDQLGVARAVALTLMGRLDDASAAIETDRRRARSADASALLTLLGAEIDLLRGDIASAQQAIDDVLRSPILADPTVAAECALQRAELALAKGDADTARSIAAHALEHITVDDQLAALRLCLVIGRAGGDPAPSADVVPVGRESVALLAELEACRTDDRRSWDVAADAWDQVPAPVNAWRCRVRAARTEDDLDRLRSLRDEVARLGAPGLVPVVESAIVAAGGRRTVARTGGVLTRRELDVLALVAEGLTNRQIAQRLSISPRTVGVHVEHCLTKLDAATRGAAVHEARRRGVLSA